MKCWYIVEGYEDRLFDDDYDACEFIGDMEDVYTDEKLQQMCEEEIYEICGMHELEEWCDGDEECMLEYITIEELYEYDEDKKRERELEEADRLATIIREDNNS